MFYFNVVVFSVHFYCARRSCFTLALYVLTSMVAGLGGDPADGQVLGVGQPGRRLLRPAKPSIRDVTGHLSRGKGIFFFLKRKSL